MLVFIGFQVRAEENNDYIEKGEKKTFKELSIKLKALEVARQVEDYIRNNPDKTLKDLQNDSVFQKIAIQQVGKTDYTAILNFDLIVKFHKQEDLIGFDAHLFKNDFPELWSILLKSDGGYDSSGYYSWRDENGIYREKYNYQAVVNEKTADKAGLIISVTTYLDEYDPEIPVNDIKNVENEKIILAKKLIKQKAIDVARQIEIYLTLNSKKTVLDLQQDEYFKKIAVQGVGKTGYTAVTDYNTLVNYFHKNPNIINLDLHTLADKLPGFWSVISQTQGGYEVEGLYDWEEADGKMKQKYMYVAIVDSKTVDGVGLSVAATTYLDEYDDLTQIKDERKQESAEELLIKLKALQVVDQIDKYLENYPQLTLEELQQNALFKNIAVQLVGKTGYTGVIDSQTGYFYFHPQEALINTDSFLLKEKLPDFWEIFNNTIGEECEESSGYYDWKESDGEITEKYLYTACVKHTTADGKKLFVGATTYIDELDATKYIKKYKINNSFSYAQDLIDQRALDIAKQIELYIKSHSQKTLEDLKQDEEFQKLAVQTVGETGYTYLVVKETGILNFHPDPKIRGVSYNSFKEKFPVIWSIANKTVISDPCEDSSGFYEWADIDGNIRDKYTYHRCIDAKTADNYTFFIGASTYLDEYEELNNTRQEQETLNVSYVSYIYWFLSGLVIVFLIISVLNQLNVIKFERTTAFYLLVIALIIIIGLFVFSTWLTANSMKKEAMNSTAKSLTAIANSRAAHVENFLKEQVEKVELIKIGNNYKKLLKMTLNDPDYQALYAEIEKRLINSVHKEMNEIFILDKDGKILVSTNKDIIGIDKSSDSYFVNAKEKTYIKDAYRSESTGKNIIVISSPFFDDKNEFLGVLVARSGMVFVNQITGNANDLGESGETYLINKEKYIITPSRFTDDAFLTQKADTLNAKNCFSMTDYAGKHIGHKAVEVFDDYRKIEVIGTHVYLPEMQWCLLAEIDKVEVLGNVTKNINKIWYFTAGIILSILIVGFMFNFLLTKSLKREVEAKTVNIKSQSSKIQEQLKKEELITKEKEKLLVGQKQAQEELEEKITEMEKFQKLTIGRELKMIELKEEIKKLKDSLNKK